MISNTLIVMERVSKLEQRPDKKIETTFTEISLNYLD